MSTFFRLLKKGVSFVWDEACQKAFNDIKQYLTNPPVLVPPVVERPFLLYVRALDHSLGALLAQKSNMGHEQAIYYLSRMMVGAEHRYTPVEKECLALVFVVQKTRHYVTGQTIHVISRINPIRVLMRKSTLADFLAAYPIPETSKLYKDIPNEVVDCNMTLKDDIWQLYFDGASRVGPKGNIVSGVGIVLVSPDKMVIYRAYSLNEPCSNNVAEYNALLIGLQVAKQLDIEFLEAYGDSQLIVNQVRGTYEVRNSDLIPYHQVVIELVLSFKGFFIEFVPRSQNLEADAFASLATDLAIPIRR
ncbi:uncharacterized protein M6B38_369495 [Iris pallida]|uniref:RNase H type-1 domain-containing protein n=1 Tax=Iris pallida TaxID=29817 RepID=A0AAX6GEE0_IRIPA|nr:uncharacterized protein M6B38_369495 [Iris pallida]